MSNETTPQNLSEDEQLSVIAPFWPKITQEEAAEATVAFGKAETMSQVDITKDAQRIITSGALISITYDDGAVTRYFLKRFHSDVMTAGQLQAKHRAANLYASQLCEQESPFRLASYQENLQGATTVSCGEWIYELSTIATGEDRYESYHSWLPPKTVEEAYSIGCALASMHKVAVSVEQPADPGPTFYDNRFELIPDLVLNGEDAIDRFCQARPTAARWLSVNAPYLGTHLREALPDGLNDQSVKEFYKLPRIWIHGDGHCSNMTFTGNQVDTIFDFGLASPAPAVIDLAIALERNSLEWISIVSGQSDAYRLDIASAIIDGYQSVRPLSSVEKELLPAIVSCVHVEAALNIIGYHLAVDRPENATWSYETYFRFHSHWFNTKSGQAYLAGLAKAI